MVPRALLGARRVVFASANPLVSVTGNSSPAAAFFVFSPCPHYLTTTYYTIGRCPVARPYTRLAAVSSGVVPSSAASSRTSASANRAGDPASPHLHSKPWAHFNLLCAAAAFVLQQPLQQRRLPCCAAPTAQHQTQLGKPGDLFQRKQTEALENFFSRLRRSTLCFSIDDDDDQTGQFFHATFFFCCLQLTAASSSSFVPTPPPIDRRRSTAQAQPGKPGDF